MSCVSSADCAEITDGCCIVAFIESIPEDGLYPEPIELGQQEGMCATAAW